MLEAQIIMVLTVVVMITGIAPLYITAVVGGVASALAAGFPLTGADPNAISKI